MTITEFINARLDEREKFANGLQFACRIPGKTPDFTAAGGPAAEAYWQHFTPGLMLRGIEAKRAIIASHKPVPVRGMAWSGCQECGTGHAWPCRTLRHIATIDDDHSDYDPNWRP